MRPQDYVKSVSSFPISRPDRPSPYPAKTPGQIMRYNMKHGITSDVHIGPSGYDDDDGLTDDFTVDPLSDIKQSPRDRANSVQISFYGQAQADHAAAASASASASVPDPLAPPSPAPAPSSSTD